MKQKRLTDIGECREAVIENYFHMATQPLKRGRQGEDHMLFEYGEIE